MRVRPLEIKALVPLLMEDWPDEEILDAEGVVIDMKPGVERLAEALIRQLDETRASRTSYIAVMQFGTNGNVWYSGLGPYPGRKSAERDVSRDPGASLADKIAVVPLTSAEGLEARLKEHG